MHVDLEKLRACYLALGDPAMYPQLRPRGSHCGMGDPDVWNLQEDILEIFGKSGILGIEHMHDIGYRGPHLVKALSEVGRKQDLEELAAILASSESSVPE